MRKKKLSLYLYVKIRYSPEINDTKRVVSGIGTLQSRRTKQVNTTLETTVSIQDIALHETQRV